MRTRDDGGFTLVELLVVMLILAALAGIAIPMFLSHRAKAYRSAMASDLHAVVIAEAAWHSDHDSYTSNPADLTPEGYRPTTGVTTHVKVSGSSYVACAKHLGQSDWLVYDSVTSSFATAAADCA